MAEVSSWCEHSDVKCRSIRKVSLLLSSGIDKKRGKIATAQSHERPRPCTYSHARTIIHMQQNLGYWYRVNFVILLFLHVACYANKSSEKFAFLKISRPAKKVNALRLCGNELMTNRCLICRPTYNEFDWATRATRVTRVPVEHPSKLPEAIAVWRGFAWVTDVNSSDRL